MYVIASDLRAAAVLRASERTTERTLCRVAAKGKYSLMTQCNAQARTHKHTRTYEWRCLAAPPLSHWMVVLYTQKRFQCAWKCAFKFSVIFCCSYFNESIQYVFKVVGKHAS